MGRHAAARSSTRKDRSRASPWTSIRPPRAGCCASACCPPERWPRRRWRDDSAESGGDRRRRHRHRVGGPVRVRRLAGRDLRCERTDTRSRPGGSGSADPGAGRARSRARRRGGARVARPQRATTLAEAVKDADWVIEAIHEDVLAKQKLLQAIELAASADALIDRKSV